MKKLLVGILVTVLCFAFCGCGDATVVSNSDQPSVEQVVGNSDQAGVEQEDENNKTGQVNVGERIVTDNMEIAINSIEMTYDVLPDNISGFYTHYEAEEGKVYICVDADVTNKAKQNLNCDEIGKVTADYNGGYNYKGFVIVDDSTTGFTYANITSIDPLETRGIKWLIECPQEVEESENSLILEFTIDGKKFTHSIR